ncbi:YggT family protein [Acidithiobacillus acidisediminis]|uniref:YggT family protein n=1 Tax=Acidithiobacillus TaxID=119977 RepID=UPI00200C15B2|nr:YggT family protein [Acidithiobacillus sp. S30A2]
MLLFDLYRLLELALTLLFWAIFLRAILSWVQPNPYNPIVRFLDRVTDPILRPLQRHLPNLGGIDLSPLVAMLLIEAAKMLLPRLFFGSL